MLDGGGWGTLDADNAQRTVRKANPKHFVLAQASALPTREALGRSPHSPSTASLAIAPAPPSVLSARAAALCSHLSIHTCGLCSQFSRHVRPGFTLIDSGDANTVAALSAEHGPAPTARTLPSPPALLLTSSAHTFCSHPLLARAGTLVLVVTNYDSPRWVTYDLSAFSSVHIT